jgi:hypothetical protein
MAMKTCTGCGVETDETMFVRDRKRNRRKSRCLSCTSAAAKEWRKKQPNYEKDRYQRERKWTRERHLIRKYDVSLEVYEKILAVQNGKCAICGALEKEQFYGVFHVDHCHKTKRVRGLLCRGCNHVLGHLRDDQELLWRAIAYLEGRVVPQIPEIIGRAIMKLEADDDYDPQDDLARSLEEAYRAIRERMANGGPAWKPRADDEEDSHATTALVQDPTTG